ncbi:hypothetical protein GCM10022403_069250 [Streptomyces coacervatus]|uniref:Sortase n=1 Tax=Streptomyces coacervatus TaxID=647381 RepID=A0ABP7ISP9_9ACTN|nr:hypothetical protein [Streptomyces coacervatus]MDF2266655.1 hypothetical protein [Streptomyces coacervatus]
MGSLRLTLCTGLLAVCALTPPVYAADGGGAGMSVTPSSPAPGTDVALGLTGCSAQAATAASTAFVADVHLAGVDGTLAGDTLVRTSAKPGSYDVKVTCAGSVTTGKITVVSQAQAQAQRQPRSVTSASPVAPVRAGGGGTAHVASEDVREAGPGAGQAITGLVLVGVAVAAVAVLTGRRRRGTD